MAGETTRGVRWQHGDLDRGVTGDDAIDRLRVAADAGAFSEVLRPGFVGPRRGVASEAWLLVVHGSQAHIERRVQGHGWEVIRWRRRHRDWHLRLGVALQAELGGPGRGGERQIRHGDMQRRHRRLRVASRAVDRYVVEAGRCDVTALTADGSGYVQGRRAEGVDVRRGRREGRMTEARGHPPVRVTAETG